MAGEKILIARQDTLEAVQRDTQAILADTAAIGGDVQTAVDKGNEIINLLGNAAGNVANGIYQTYGDSQTGVTLNQNLVLLDIQGRGKLYWVYFYGSFSTGTTAGLTSANTYIDFKVTIDDKVNFYLHFYPSSGKSNLSTYFLFADMNNMVKTVTGSTAQTAFRTPDYLGSVNTGQEIRTVQLSHEMQEIDISRSSGSYAEICQILDYIKFEKSIKVEALLHSTASISTGYPKYTYSVGCILDE